MGECKACGYEGQPVEEMTARGGFYLHCPNVECGAPWEAEPGPAADDATAMPVAVDDPMVAEIAGKDIAAIAPQPTMPERYWRGPKITTAPDTDNPAVNILRQRLKQLDAEREKLIRALDVLTKDL